MPLVDAIFCTTHAVDHWPPWPKSLRRRAAYALSTTRRFPRDITVFKTKCARICWEFMFARSLFKTSTCGGAGRNTLTQWLAWWKPNLSTTLADTLHGLCADTVRQAHPRQPRGNGGKQVIVQTAAAAQRHPARLRDKR